MINKLNRIIIIVIILAIMLSLGCVSQPTANAKPCQGEECKLYKLYIPFIAKSWRPILGAQIEGDATPWTQYIPDGSAVELQLKWMDVEPVRGTYTWPTWMDTAVTNLRWHTLIIQFRGAVPEWARVPGALMCQAPDIRYYANFATFVQKVVKRYSPSYIEVWNEPDAQHRDAAAAPFFGCLDNGTQYMDILRAVVAALGDAPVKVLGGALMLNLNTPDPSFVDQMVAGGVNDLADGVSFHAYEYIGAPSMGDEIPRKVAFLREHGVTLPLYCTETSRLYNGASLTAAQEQEQADYLRVAYDLAQSAHDVEMILWYSINSAWKNSELVLNGNKKAAWWELQRLLVGWEP